MAQIVFSLAAALVAFWITHSYVYPALFREAPKEIAGLSLEKTIREIKAELAEIGRAPGKTAGLVLKDVKVAFTAQRDDKATASGTLVVPVFEETALTADRSLKISRGSKITVVFQPPTGQELLASERDGQLDLSELVLSARNALLSTQGEAPNLTPKSVDIEVLFIFVKSSTTSAGIKAHVVSIGAASEEVETGGNTIILQYRNPALTSDEEESAPLPPR